MEKGWINPKIVIGNAVTGDYYYHRPQIVKDIWDELELGNHVLLMAPRRVGKSSIMKYMVKNAPAQYKCIFKNIQGLKSAEGFFQTLYELIKSCLSLGERSAKWLQEFFEKFKIEEISADGTIKFGGRTISYLEAVNHILPQLQSRNTTLVLFIDELPEVLHGLYKANKSDEAILILKNLRRWRQDDQFSKFRLVLAGSIGIDHVVKAIEGRIIDKNDFGEVKFEGLAEAEAKDYIQWATSNNATIQYSETNTVYLLSKVQYHLPYFINLMLNEINRSAFKADKRVIAEIDIDAAFDKVVKDSSYFSDWKNRLFDYLPRADAEFLNDVLIHISHHNFINKRKLFDIALSHGKKIDYMDMVDGLERDGYIIESNDSYVFVSPFLQSYWKRNNPVYA
jgi:uncharacterized protein